MPALAQPEGEGSPEGDLDGGDRIEIQAGRHPVIEATQTDVTFVPNDTVLDRKDQSVGIITGPNMAGKSTFLRQNALIALAGFFIAAKLPAWATLVLAMALDLTIELVIGDGFVLGTLKLFQG